MDEVEGYIMILLETNDLYFNTQVYFKNNLMGDLPNNDKVWRQTYHAWLKSQGAVIVKSNHNLVCNVLGVAPFSDKFGFENEQDATMFVLRWS